MFFAFPIRRSELSKQIDTCIENYFVVLLYCANS